MASGILNDLATAALVLCTAAWLGGCAGTTEGPVYPQHPLHGNGEGSGTIVKRGEPIVKEYDITKEQFDVRSYNEFIRTRCLELGRALINLSAEESDRAALAESDIQRWMQKDDARVKAFTDQKRPASDASGLVIPRYIRTELDKKKADRDLAFLRTQGRLLALTYDFETLQVTVWYDTATKMLKLGNAGREFLAAQMVVRMRLANSEFRDVAKDILVNRVPDEAVEPLIAATHIEFADQPGVFPREAASVLAQLGKRATPKILELFRDKDGKHIACNDSLFLVRKYFVDALGVIGDSAATDTLIAELDGMRFPGGGDDRRYVYATRLVTALGGIGDKKAVKAIVKVWKSFSDPTDFAKTARTSLRRITGENYDDPDSVPLNK